MKRDLELIRELFLRIEDYPSIFKKGYNYELKIDNFTKEDIDFHLYLMKNANFIDGIINKSIINKHLSVHYETIEITWSGYEFLGSIRNKKVWQSFKKKYANLDLPFSIISELCKKILTQLIMTQIK